MSVIPYTIEQITPVSVVCTWAGLHNGDTGTPIPIQGFASKHGTLSGIRGVGGQLDLEISSSSQIPAWSLVSSLTTVPSDFGSTTFVPSLFRPNVSAGDGSTNLTLTVVFTNVETTL